jgi:hypothetical protein
MKKATIFSAVFLFVFGLTAGMVVGLNENAAAIEQCAGPCLVTTYCSLHTGALCPDPSKPYYVYLKALCAGGPGNCPFIYEQCDCWNGVEPCRVWCLVL